LPFQSSVVPLIVSTNESQLTPSTHVVSASGEAPPSALPLNVTALPVALKLAAAGCDAAAGKVTINPAIKPTAGIVRIHDDSRLLMRSPFLNFG
jgi:hypothetical protein